MIQQPQDINPFKLQFDLLQQANSKLDHLIGLYNNKSPEALDFTKPMTVTVLSIYLSCSEQKIYKKIKKKSIPYHLKDDERTYYFFKDEIDEYLKSN
jgi:excisionase family DNA binding protein